MWNDSIQHLNYQRSVGRFAVISLSVALLLGGAIGGLGKFSLLWAGAPLSLFWLVEAGYAAQQKRVVELMKTKGSGDDASLFIPGAAIGEFVLSVFSLGIFPFYLALFGIFTAAAFYMPVKVSAPQTVTIAAPTPAAPFQPYRPTTTGPMPPQYFPPRPVGATPFPFPAQTLGTPPGLPTNGRPVMPLPNPAVVRAPQPNPTTPFSGATPNTAAPASSTPPAAKP